MRIALLTLTLALSSVVWGQSFTPAPVLQHSFWDRGNAALIVSDGVAKGFDAYFTHRALEGKLVLAHCYTNEFGGQTCTVAYWKTASEVDPIARPFVRTTAGQVGYFAGTWAGDIGLAYLMHRTGHHKLEKITLSVGIGSSLYGGVTSAHTTFTF